jgi:hypothetical protein
MPLELPKSGAKTLIQVPARSYTVIQFGNKGQ